MVFEKGLKNDNSKWDKVVRKLVGENYNPVQKENYELGKGYPKQKKGEK